MGGLHSRNSDSPDQVSVFGCTTNSDSVCVCVSTHTYTRVCTGKIQNFSGMVEVQSWEFGVQGLRFGVQGCLWSERLGLGEKGLGRS